MKCCQTHCWSKACALGGFLSPSSSLPLPSSSLSSSLLLLSVVIIISLIFLLSLLLLYLPPPALFFSFSSYFFSSYSSWKMSVEGEIIPGLLGIIYLQIESLSTRFSPRNIVLNTSSFIRSYFFGIFLSICIC